MSESGEPPPPESTPVKGIPLKSPFLSSCRRMGLKRRSGISPMVTQNFSPAAVSSADSPCAKKAVPVEPLVISHSDATPKRKVASKRSKGLCVTRVVRPELSSDVKEAQLKKTETEANSKLEDLEASVLKKKELIDLLQRGIHPLQAESERLKALTTMWRIGCQRALEDLIEKLHKNSEEAAKVLTMKILISNLDIPPDLINFDPDKEEFY